MPGLAHRHLAQRLALRPAVAPRLRELAAASSVALAVQACEPAARALGGGRRRRPARPRLSRWRCALLLRARAPRSRRRRAPTTTLRGRRPRLRWRPSRRGTRSASTRLVLLVTGAEEAGTLGADAFLRAHDTSEWLFLNFDGVSAPATLRYLSHEGILRKWPADERLIGVAEALRERRPELGLEPMDVPAGLTYDATPVLARGGRALTISAQDAGRIPNYHRPSDDVSNVDAETFSRALEIGRELIAAVDRGEAD